MSPRAVGNVSQDLDPVLELDPKHSVGEWLQHAARDDLTGLGHERLVYRIAIATCGWVRRRSGPSWWRPEP